MQSSPQGCIPTLWLNIAAGLLLVIGLLCFMGTAFGAAVFFVILGSVFGIFGYVQGRADQSNVSVPDADLHFISPSRHLEEIKKPRRTRRPTLDPLCKVCGKKRVDIDDMCGMCWENGGIEHVGIDDRHF